MLYPIHTIGHGSRKPDIFLGLLQKFGIGFLIDVRSMPHSRFHPQFNRNTLKEFLEKNGIRYVYMGDALGGRPKDNRFYDPAGRVSYSSISVSDAFREGIARLKKAYEQALPVAVMCSERAPAACHRAKLIAPALEKIHVPVVHINEKGESESQASVLRKIRPEERT